MIRAEQTGAAYHLNEPTGLRNRHNERPIGWTSLAMPMLDSLKKISKTAAKLIGVLAILAAIASAVSFLMATGRDTPVSQKADYRLNWSVRNYLTGPFAFMSEGERYRLRLAKDEIERAVRLMQAEGWTSEGVDRYCGQAYETNKVPVFRSGVTYGDVVDLHDEYGALMTSLRPRLELNCLFRAWSAIELQTSPPFYRQSEYGAFRVTGPRIVATNNRRRPVSRLTILWEVTALGRPGSIATGRISQEIVGGLMPGEEYTFASATWDQSNTARLAELLRRLDDVQLEVSACVSSVDGEDTHILSREYGCLEDLRRSAIAAAAISEWRSELLRLTEQPLIATP